MIFDLLKLLFSIIFNHNSFQSELQKHIESSPYRDTLYSKEWIIQHHDALMNLLPDVWTHVDNIDYAMFGLKLTLLNIPWENKEDLENIISYFESLSLITRKHGYQIVRNQDNPFGIAAQNNQ